MPRLRSLAPFLALCAACSSPALRWEMEPDAALALHRDGELVWRFAYGPDRAKPCFHPLALPGGRTLTLDAPADHSWHHGLWFSWKLIDGVNYWEPAADGRPAGRSSWTVQSLDGRPDGSARLELALEYGPRESPAVLRETRVIDVHAPAADGSFAIDWDARFLTLADCVLDRTPPPGEPKGQVNGGYAGLALRLVNLVDRDACSTAGPATWNTSDRARAVAAAFEYGGLLDGEPCGVAVLDHPSNPRAPTAWYAVRSTAMSFFCAAWLVPGVKRLTTGEEFRLRYRVVVHPGRWDAERLRAESAAYGAKSP